MSSDIKHYKKINYYKGILLEECVPMSNHAGYFIMYTLNGKKWVESIGYTAYVTMVTSEIVPDP